MSFVLARNYVFLVYFQFIYLQCVFFVESYIYCLRCVLCVFYSNWISLLLFIPKLDACFCSLRFLNKGSQLFHIKMESHIVKQFYKVIKATNSIQCKCYINNTASLRLWLHSKLLALIVASFCNYISSFGISIIGIEIFNF